MDVLDPRFTVKTEHELGGSGSRLFTASTAAGQNALVLKLVRINEEMIREYVSLHREHMDAQPLHMGRKLLFIFDARESQHRTEDIARILPVIQPFVDVHVESKMKYLRCLLCTIIVINNEFARQLLNMFIGPIYTPTRPLKVMDAKEDVRAVVASLWANSRQGGRRCGAAAPAFTSA